MAKQNSTDENEEITVQGADGSSEGIATESLSQPLIAEDPEWLAELLKSNQDVIQSNQAVIESNESVAESNQAVIDALTKLRDHASRRVGNYQSEIQKQIVLEYDPEMDYHVADGKEFRAPSDFTTVHREGDNVNHLGKDKLQSLLSQGLVAPVDPED